MILYRYFARRFLMTFAGMFAVFFLFYAMLDMIEIIRKFGGLGFAEILRLTMLNVPAGIYRILPLVTILATIMLFLNLARSSELVVTRAAGRSALRSLISPLLVAFAIGVVAVAAFNPIVAATSRQYEALANKYRKGTESVLSITREGLWLRQGGKDGPTVINAGRANADGTELFGVTFIGFGADGLPRERIEAERARLSDGAWLVENAKRWRFGNGANPEAEAERLARLTVPSDLTRERIRDGFGAPSTIPLWELPAFIDSLEKAGFSSRRHRVWFLSELAQPLLLVAMVMIGAGFTMRHTRFGRTGLMVLLALLMGFAIYFIRNFAQILGENGQIPPWLAAWAPPSAAILLALGLLLHLEDG